VSELTSVAAARSESGWEIVVDDLAPAAVAHFDQRAAVITRIAERRYALHLPPLSRPEPVIAELAGAGARLISASPASATLEQVFLSALASDAEVRAGRPSTSGAA
jgi:hypothetical protein